LLPPALVFAGGAFLAGPPAASGVDVVAAGRWLELTGTVASGALATCVVAGVVRALEVPGAGVPRAPALFTADFVVALRADLPLALASRMSIRGTLARASGIDALPGAVAGLDHKLSRVVGLGRSARPIAKQPKNTATHKPIAASAMRSSSVMRRSGMSSLHPLRRARS
jgi:hypothetical protein